MIFKQQLTDISTVLNNTGNIAKLLTSFNALDINQQKVLLSSSLLSEKQKEQCITMTTLSAANIKYTAEQLAKATGISTEALANWGLIESTDALTISEIAEKAASDAQAKTVLNKIIAQNAEAVANGKITASNTALAASEGSATLAIGTFTTAIKANMKAIWAWLTTTPLGWLTILITSVFAVVKAYDALTVSIKEQKEKLEASSSVYEDAKNKLSNVTTELEKQEQAMDDLLAKEKLTYTEQGQLETLQAITKELRIQKDLSEKETAKSQREVAQDASDLFNKQFGKYDISENAINEWQNGITHNEGLRSDPDDISAMIALYKRYNDLLIEAYGSSNQDNIEHFKLLTENIKDTIFETAQVLQEQQSNITDYYNIIKDMPYDDLTEKQKEIITSYNSISNVIELIYQQLDPNAWKTMQIENVFDTEGIEKNKEELIELAKEGALDESVVQSYPKLSEALKQNKISASELCHELELLVEAENNIKDDSFSNKTPTPFTQAWSDSFTSENETVRELGNNLLALAEQGRLTIETFNKTDSTGYFKNLGISADEAVLKINKLVDESTQLSAMSGQISAIAGALGTKQTDGFVSADTLSGFDAEIRGLKSWDQFQAVLGSTASSYQDCQKAANALTTEWARSNDFLAQLTEGNKDYYETQLKAMGVENTSEVISDALSAKEALVLQEQILAAETEAVANNTNFSVAAFLSEAGATEITRACLFQLVTAEQVFNNTDLSTAEKIEKLKELANAYGQTAIAARIANMEKAEQDGHVPIDYEKELAALQTDINNAVGSVQIDFNGMNGAASHAAGAGKSAAESYIEAFEEELSDLSQLRDNGVITEKEYLDSLRALYERYFASKLGYEKEYAKYQRQYLEGYKSLYESALSGISTLLGNQIDGYKDAKDARLEVIDTQKEQLEAQKDLIDEQIEAKQKLIDDIQNEIDAMKEANSERQRQLDLQKAQYELERMQHQRTILQYSEENGMQYVQNDEGLRTAKENVDNAKFEIEISNKEKNISLLEDEISLLEEQKDAIQNQMDLLDKQADQIESYYLKMISETEAYYDSLINNMERQKSKWEEIAEIESVARAYSDLEQVAWATASRIF